jgi:hypothetical protein
LDILVDLATVKNSNGLSKLLQPKTFSRSSAPFSFQDFLTTHSRPISPRLLPTTGTMADAEKKVRVSGEQARVEPAASSASILPTTEKPLPPKPSLHPAFYVVTWIGFSGGVILFNKWLLDTLGFKFPITLTAWHMLFATFMTQLLARTTSLLDGRKTVKMTGKVYLRAILPIGFFFSLSLICGNKAYLYLSVAFIQMLKVS